MLLRINESGPDLDGDLSSGHGQVGAVLRPGVDQLTPHSHQGLGERRLAIIVHTRGTHYGLLMVQTAKRFGIETFLNVEEIKLSLKGIQGYFLQVIVFLNNMYSHKKTRHLL